MNQSTQRRVARTLRPPGPEEFSALISDRLAMATKRPAIISDIAERFPLNQVIDAYRKLESDVHGKVLVVPGL